MACRWSKNVSTVTTLIDAGADLDLQDDYGRTALMFAAFSGNTGKWQTVPNLADIFRMNSPELFNRAVLIHLYSPYSPGPARVTKTTRLRSAVTAIIKTTC
eukprot:4036869-Pyramimonas_sp.AAC.3